MKSLAALFFLLCCFTQAPANATVQVQTESDTIEIIERRFGQLSFRYQKRIYTSVQILTVLEADDEALRLFKRARRIRAIGWPFGLIGAGFIGKQLITMIFGDALINAYETGTGVAATGLYLLSVEYYQKYAFEAVGRFNKVATSPASSPISD